MHGESEHEAKHEVHVWPHAPDSRVLERDPIGEFYLTRAAEARAVDGDITIDGVDQIAARVVIDRIAELRMVEEVIGLSTKLRCYTPCNRNVLEDGKPCCVVTGSVELVTTDGSNARIDTRSIQRRSSKRGAIEIGEASACDAGIIFDQASMRGTDQVRPDNDTIGRAARSYYVERCARTYADERAELPASNQIVQPLVDTGTITPATTIGHLDESRERRCVALVIVCIAMIQAELWSCSSNWYR